MPAEGEEMETNTAYLLMACTLIAFGYVGYRASFEKDLDADSYLSARGTQSWQRIGLSLFASGMGIWILFTPSEVGYYGGFWNVVGYAVSAATPFMLLAYVGPMIRERLPSGVTLADYVRLRLGRTMQVYVGLISVLYMFTFLFAEFTAIGKAMDTLSEMEPLIPMAMVGIVTAAYISQGGLPASLATDRVQAWTIMFLVVVLLLVLFGGDINGLITDSKAYNPEDSWSIGSMSYMDSFQSGLALVVAITAAEMFSQGNWQRAWASESDEALTKGAWLAAGLVLPLVFVMGVLGTVVAGQGAVDDPSAAFFYLIEDAGVLFVAAFIVLAVALACSSIDTLQNGIVASFSRDLSDGSMGLAMSRVATIAMIPLAIYLATGPTILGFDFNDAWSVFGIFLFADIMAAATVAPIFITLWDGVSSKGALLGCFAGILSIFVYGIIEPPTNSEFYMYLFHPTIEAIPASQGGMTNLWPFLSAILGSALVTVMGSYVLPDEQ
jgi:Na+/proline symporter